MATKDAPELVVGLVGAVGSPLEAAARAVEVSISRFGYTTTHIRLSEFLDNIPLVRSDVDKSTEHARLRSAMNAGTRLRQTAKRGDALVAYAAAKMRATRRITPGENGTSQSPVEGIRDLPAPLANRCFVLKSLKHPDEVNRLRSLYQDQFILIGVYSPREQRVRDLAERLAQHSAGHQEVMRAEAEALIAVDEKESGTNLGQNVRDTFPLADAFITAASLQRESDRIFDLVFAHPFVTPTRDEHGMFHAQAAALRSGALARQVGACVTNTAGDILAVGCNEVPRAGGGQYWPGEGHDGRDFAVGHDRNDRLKNRLLRDLVVRLRKSTWLTEAVQSKSVDQVLSELMDDGAPEGTPRLKESLLAGLTEFGRDVHAEMSALMTIARQPSRSVGSTLYCTTFPCHNCAKHIIAAGVSRVVYVEPYAKSFAAEFHPEAIAVESEGCADSRVRCEPFYGVAPRRYLELFRSGRRKDRAGVSLPWDPREALPWFIDPASGGYDQADLAAENEFVKEILAVSQ